jgi:hypothetical protein
MSLSLARDAGEGIKPGVERSGTPGSNAHRMRARGAGESGSNIERLSPTSWAQFLLCHFPGVPLRSTPGFMLPPASRVEESILE